MEAEIHTVPVQQKLAEPLIYLSGRVCGLNYQNVVAKFRARQLELEAYGFNVINPCEAVPFEISQDTARRASIRLLSTCEYICMLPDWEQGDFCRTEFAIAVKLGITPME